MITIVIVAVIVGAVAAYLFLRANSKKAAALNAEVNTLAKK